VIHVAGFGPHRLNAPSRPAWFFEKKKYGGILCDIGSHQFDQFLAFSGAKDARVQHASVGNYNNPDHPELEDMGEANLVADNGATNYGASIGSRRMACIRGATADVHPRNERLHRIGASTRTWRQKTRATIFPREREGERHLRLAGKVGFPFFGQLILDCINRTENAMTQEHAFKAAELCLQAQRWR